MARPRTPKSNAGAGDATARVTVDELARSAGTTTRQVRALQTGGLLPRPHLVGRTGYYDGDHLDRLRAILRLQADGFSLAGIRSLVEAWEADLTLAEVLGLHAPSGPVPEDDAEGFAALVDSVDRTRPRSRRLLSLVPTTLLDQPAAS